MNVERRQQAEDHWDEVSFVIRSKYRTSVLEKLNDGPATPSRIASYSNLSLSHVSRALRELRDRELVELLVSEHQKKGRLYGPTLHADQVWKTIESKSLH